MNTNKDYSVTVNIRSNPASVFNALTKEISNWWGQMDHPVQKQGEVFKVSWGEPWYEFRVEEFEPNNKVSWRCIDANQIIGELEGVEKEWVGTKLDWSIAEIGSGEVRLSLKHEGLIPDFICYDFCSTTWDRFVKIALKEYLEK